jgi:phosphoenolpyruvate---glycerone phosphotransferase subunit DhaL
MSQVITLAQFRAWLLAFAQEIADHQEYLTELDASIGDADHGINMQRGMHKVSERLRDSDNQVEDVASLFRTVAMTLISTVGGAAGPLYGAFFLRAVRNIDGSATVTPDQLAAMFRDGLEGVQQRGKAELNEKTMVDALQPAVEALESAVAAGEDIGTALNAAAAQAEHGMKGTADLQASKGRASYLGPRSIGHQDPGATSTFYLIQSAAVALGRSVPETASAPE